MRIFTRELYEKRRGNITCGIHRPYDMAGALDLPHPNVLDIICLDHALENHWNVTHLNGRLKVPDALTFLSGTHRLGGTR